MGSIHHEEGVADGTQVVVDAGPGPAVATATVGSRFTARFPAPRSPLAGATVPDHLDVLGIGERLREVTVEVGSVAGDDEELPFHAGNSTPFQPLKSSGTFGTTGMARPSTL